MTRIGLLFALMLAASLRFAEAAEVKHGAITLADAWARATTASAQTGGAYVRIVNSGQAPDKLLSARSEIAAQTQLHETIEANGVMKMRELAEGVALPAGGSVEFRPGGYHVMLIGLVRPLVSGEAFPLTLTFERAGPVQIAVEVKPANHAPGGHHGHGGPHGRH